MALVVDGILLAFGTLVLAAAARKVGLPPLLGMIIAGVVVGAFDLSAGLDGPRLDDFSSSIRLAVLTVILLRAGLGISGSDLRIAGPLGLRLATLPLLGDILLVTGGAVFLFDLGVLEALVLGALVAAISPAIVIPGLLELMGRGGEKRERVLKSLLVGAPLDNILALVIMGVALDAALPGNSSIAVALMDLLWRVGFGLGLGAIVGFLAGQVIRKLGDRGGEWVSAIGVLLCGGGLVVAGLELSFSFVLSLIAFGGVVRAIAPDARDGIDARLLSIWKVAQYALFGLIGAAVDLGPLASVGFAVVAVVLLGQLGRATGSVMATARSGLDSKERAACVMAYIPKATIQAAFAAIPLDRGLASGELFLVTAVVAIVITAPLGVVTLRRGVDRLLQ